LLGLERRQQGRAFQEEQRSEKVQQVGAQNGDHREPEERRKQRESPAHRLEQLIQDERHGDIAQQVDEYGGGAPAVQGLVRQNVGRRSRGVAIYNHPAANEELGE